MLEHRLSDHSSRRGRPTPAPRRPRASLTPHPIILFVEDNEVLRFTVTTDLEDAGYGVIQANRGEEAISYLTGPTVIDALLTDLRLPGSIDGWDIAERARQLRPGLPVVYASAYSYMSPRQVPGSIMLDKPYRREALLDALDALLD